MKLKVKSPLLLLLSLLTLLAAYPLEASPPPAKRHILLLNSYHATMPWVRNVVQAVEDAIEPRQGQLNLHTEYMDTKQVPYDETYQGLLYALLEQKYRQTPVELVMVSDNNAFEFMRAYGERLFPGVPVVFCGVNNFQAAWIEEFPHFTGIAEVFDAKATLAAALEMHPHTQRVFIINDHLPTGQAWAASIRQQLAGFEKRVELIFSREWPFTVLEERVAGLDADTLVLFGVYFRDATGQYYDFWESMGRLSRVSPVPIYGLLDLYLGYGLAGGNLISGYHQGEEAARFALAILDGQSPNQLPVSWSGTNRFMFDYKQMQRFGISAAQLPPASTIVNQPPSLLREYALFFWSAVGVILLLTVLVLLLAANVIRRKKAESALQESKDHLEVRVEERTRALFESEQRFRGLVETLNDWIWEIDREGCYTYVSPKVEALLGYPPEELIGTRPQALWEPSSIPGIEALLRRHYQEQTPFADLEVPTLKRDGTLIFVEVNGQPIIDSEGEFFGFRGVVRDITSRRAAEEALRDSEERFHQFMLHTPLVAFIKDDRGRMVYANAAWEKLTGRQRSGWEGRTSYDFYPGEIADSLAADDREVLLSGQHRVFQESVPRGDKISHWLSHKFGFRNSRGEHFLGGVAFDITERTRMEAELRENEATFRAIFDQGGMGIAMGDLNGRLLQVNAAFARILGYTPQELDGYCWQHISHPDGLKDNIRFYQEVLAGERASFELEKRYFRKGGGTVWAHLTVTPVLSTNGQVAFVIGMIQDITQRKRMETDLEQAKSRAESANRAKSEFLAAMSHDLRTPLNAIIGLGDVLRESHLDKVQRSYLDIVINAGDTLLVLINDILDLSKIEAGQMQLEEQPFDLGALLEEVVSVLRVNADSKEIALHCQSEGEKPIWVKGDSQRLRQILYNLLGNAIKFTQKGSVELKAVPLDSQKMHFEVRDTGIGIAPERLEKVFEPFQQAEGSRTTSRFGGTGLGLSICRKLVTLMGGEIGVQSVVDEGSVFSFTVELPSVLMEAGDGFDPGRERGSSQAQGVALDRGLEILAVDDAMDNLLLLKAYLKKTPHTLTLANNGQEAVERFQAGRFDVVLMDIQMPVMDGYAATRAIRAWERETGCLPTRIIALTAHVMKEVAQKVAAAGCDGHLAKPIRKETLLKALAQPLSGVREGHLVGHESQGSGG
ncbi:MAG: PAS domain S-box protein [Magnetococcales bacterium]|nr:PAS domain S-box protein [Magnetococcales bacterium]